MENNKAFNSWVHKFGIGSSIVILLLMFSLPLSVSVVYDVWPKLAEIWPACVTLMLMMAPWFPGEIFGFMPIMGPGAIYMCYITGNVTNLRMPATVGTMNSLGLEANTDECHTMAIIACGASNLTTLVLLFLGLLLSVPLQPVLTNPTLQPAFDYALPALFGGLVAQSVLKSKGQFFLFLIPLIVCVACALFTSIPTAFYMLITVGVGAFVFYLFGYKLRKKAD